MATTPKGIWYPLPSEPNNIPLHLKTMAEYADANPGIANMTTAERNALSGAQLWTGRTIYNLTAGNLETWDGTAWSETGSVLLGLVQALRDQARQARDEARDISSIDTTDDAVDAVLKLEDGKAQATLAGTYGPVAILNPESEQHDAVGQVVDARLGGGVAGMLKVVDARDDLTVARPTWAGQIVWLINPGSSNPVNIADGDLVWNVDTEPVPWTPALLPNKIAWFDAQALALDDGDPVASWTDLSGHDRHAAQSDPAKRPILDAAKINGHPAVVADGSDDFLVADLGAGETGSFTIYAVAGTDVADNVSTADYLWDVYEDGVPSVRGGLYRGTDESYNLQRTMTLSSAAGAWATGPKLIKAVIDGAGSSITVDETVVASGNLGAGLINRLMLFGRSTATVNHFPGYAGEVIVFSGVLTSGNDAEVLAYLADRWDL